MVDRILPAGARLRSLRPVGRKRWTGRIVPALLVALFVGLALYAGRLGYWGGPVFTEVPATAPAPAAESGTAAVFFSGDMGFTTGMGPAIARRLAQQGIPVVGVNSLTAFARRRSPDEAAALVAQAVARAAALPGVRHVLLVGQSFGANVILLGEPRLPPALRAKVSMVQLLVPEDTMLLRATPGGLMSWWGDGPALPYARAVADVPVICVRGRDEAGSLCPLWHQANVRALTLPGDHFLHYDSPLVAATLLRAFIDRPAAG
ncbi:hypothetical protein GCM10011380_09730 [Sphingomonas metalli]|uniref:Bacterial virulence domain-containing protein n=1 Tax=Sphingomonas metalli TaxID=1779358 RepID=A0A916SY11_9SPHN|nr:AcvB/VirJ family lysyl-phosphatidylglycerol hydrolase [Sphingomonas metalli]GGB22215.1 hypothetical protein GCM10011380_09730 [Sphingomonas metalli]